MVLFDYNGLKIALGASYFITQMLGTNILKCLEKLYILAANNQSFIMT